jgi:hypothetical protein
MTSSAVDVFVQFPPEALPHDADDVDELWTKLETWVQETLEPVGVGKVTIDLASELTAVAEVGDAERAVTVLSDRIGGSGLPEGAVIAVRREPTVTVQWPPERRGERLE